MKAEQVWLVDEVDGKDSYGQQGERGFSK